MPSASIFSGAALKGAVVGTLLFLASLLATGFFVFDVVHNAMYDELEAQIVEEILLFRKIYDEGGQAALLDAVTQLERSDRTMERPVGAFDDGNAKLVGNVDIAPDFLGFNHITLTLSTRSDAARYYVHATKVDGTKLVVGRNLREIGTVKQALTIALTFAGLAVALATLTLGYLISRRVSFKLDRLATTLEKVSNGNSQIRVPVGRSDDQIDHLARQINVHLERLAHLMSTMRNATKAIAHDLRTPLNRASLLLQEAASAGNDEATVGQIERARRELQHVTSIFDTIMRISRIESTTDRSGFSRVPVADILTDMIETYGPIAEDAGRSIAVQAGSEGALVLHCDPKMIRQMLANLIENSIGHGSPGNRITLSAARNADGATQLRVSDNGPGIPAELRSEVFKPFFRVDDSRTKRGTGLGLALVQAIAFCHGATVRLEDNCPGLRTVITFPVS